MGGKSKGPFTVFAPTDAAFAKLVKILTYHVVAGKVLATDVVKLSSAKTVEGSEVKITVAGGKVKVDDANVVKTDMATSKGVIHVIESVLLPKSKSAERGPHGPLLMLRTRVYPFSGRTGSSFPGSFCERIVLPVCRPDAS